MTVSKILYGASGYDDDGSCSRSLGVFAVGAPGVPGGTVMASLGLITGVLGFDATGTALMLDDLLRLLYVLVLPARNG